MAAGMLADCATCARPFSTRLANHGLVITRLNGRLHRREVQVQAAKTKPAKAQTAKKRTSARTKTAELLQKTAQPVDSTDEVEALEEPELEVVEERLGNCLVTLDLTVPAHTCHEAYNLSMKAAQKDVKIPGFRPGSQQVPENVVIAAVGPEAIKGGAVELILKNLVPVVMERFKDRFLQDSERIVSKIDDMVAAFRAEEPFRFSMTFEEMPRLKWTRPYGEMQVRVEAEVAETQCRVEAERVLRQLRKDRGTLRLSMDRGLERGDVAIVDFNLIRKDNGEAIPGARKEAMQLDTDAPERDFLPGVLDQMIGMRVTEKKEIDVRLPDWWEPDVFRGLETTAHIGLRELLTWDLDPLTDEWAESNFPGCGGVAGLQDNIVGEQLAVRDAANAEKVKEELLEHLTSLAEVAVPESMVQDVGLNEYQHKLFQLQSRGKLSMPQVRELATEEMAGNFIRSRRPELEEMARVILAVDEVFREQGLVVPEQEVQAQVDEVLKEDQGDGFDPDKLREQVTETLKTEKVVDWLKANVKWELVDC